MYLLCIFLLDIHVLSLYLILSLLCFLPYGPRQRLEWRMGKEKSNDVNCALSF